MALDPASQARFDQLRARYFPAAINYLQAHVTMFHHLPGEHRAAIEAQLGALCGTMPPSPFSVGGARFLGRGTALALEMPRILALRAALARTWQPWLTAQDRQTWKPHVTIQNKVSAAEARHTYGLVQAGFSPWDGQATGVCLWAYLGGPWQPLSHTPFKSGLLEP